MAVPSRVELATLLDRDRARLSQGLLRLVGEQRLRLDRAERGLPDLPALLGGARQRLDDRAERLVMALPNLLAARRAALDRAERAIPDAPGLVRAARLAVGERAYRLQIALPGLVRERRAALDRVERAMLGAPALLAPRHQALARMHLDAALRHAVARQRQRASPALARLSPAMLQAGLREARRQLAGSAAHLDSVSYEKVLERGFALVSDRAGHPITRAAEVGKGARLRLRFADGIVEAQAAGSAQGTLAC